MSAAAGFGNAGKKAVHVKWAGKTIALGTFPASEADEKCARAKALTRTWRSTMRPKPSRDWVMMELERLGVRVVSGRLGRKAGEEGEEGAMGEPKKPIGGAGPMGMGGGGPPVERSNSMGWGTDADFNQLMARRNSSLGLSMMNEGRRGSLSSLGHGLGLDGDPSMPPHRPLVGGGAAAAFEAARHDHYAQKEQQRRASSLGLGSLGGGLGNMGMSVNPNQHYEMLKLHHMNLLNEIQETTLMMNLYQQQQLQQQQQQLQQQASAEQIGSGADAQMAMLLQNQGQSGLDQMFGGGARGSLGLGSSHLGAGNFNTQQQMQMMQREMNASAMLGGNGDHSMPPDQSNGDLDGRLAQLKEDMARQGTPSENTSKRSAEEAEGSPAKRPKVEDTAPPAASNDSDGEQGEAKAV